MCIRAKMSLGMGTLGLLDSGITFLDKDETF